jgi:phosphate starvation-inducible protein PhoH and related proteins
MSRKPRYLKPTQAETFIKPLTLKNSSQEHYVNTITESIVTFCSGPAGTGKTYLATYVALQALLSNEVDKIILTRPLVATEDIGYLPGDMNEKIHPYLMPLFDAIEAHVGVNRAKVLFDDRRIEILPLAYMRGRSLNRSFMILDEAQNTTKEQMKMFLTRIGDDSKIVITGDPAQSDLPKQLENGLVYAVDRLRSASAEIALVEFNARHIVRNPLIEKILQYLDGPGEPNRRRARE